jgi:hypothetical protein
MSRRNTFALVWLAMGVGALGLYLLTTQYTPARFSVRAGGQEVHDRSTGLTWRRCAEGMQWTEAGEHAAQQAGWRLPTVRELHTLVDGARSHPAIDTEAFPDTPPTWFWSASQANSRITHAWLVHFGEGRANMALKLNHMPARLVRR